MQLHIMKYILVLLTVLSFNTFAERLMQLHPDFPVIEGKYQITNTWLISLDQKYNRRIEDGSMVIWRPGVTIWLVAWENNDNKSIKERIKNTKKDISNRAYDYLEKIDGNLGTVQYFLKEEENGNIQIGLNGIIFNEGGQLQVSIYYDKSADEKLVKELFNGIKGNNQN